MKEISSSLTTQTPLHLQSDQPEKKPTSTRNSFFRSLLGHFCCVKCEPSTKYTPLRFLDNNQDSCRLEAGKYMTSSGHELSNENNAAQSASTKQIPATEKPCKSPVEKLMPANVIKKHIIHTIPMRETCALRKGQQVAALKVRPYEVLHSSEIEDLEYRIVTDEQTIQKKLKKARQAADIQRKHDNPRLLHLKTPDKFFVNIGEYPEVTNSSEGSFEIAYTKKPRTSTVEYKTVSVPSCGIASCQGARSSMEDAHIASQFTITVAGLEHTIRITGIFDGHGSSDWSKYVSKHIINPLKGRLEEFNQNGLCDTGIWNALKIAFADQDHMAGKDFSASGTTANVALLINGDLWISNLGDSRALLLDKHGSATQLSEDAKPDNQKYTRSITKRQGTVKDNMIIGKAWGLRIARAFGDHTHYDSAVSSRPKITKVSARKLQEKKLIQVCDGITDAASSNDIARAVHTELTQDHSLAVTSANLVARAYQAGSTDNLSAIVSIFS
ncbi:PP2C family serine/threonine-protein phosphatase [Endozoicomonas sp.]|uniref:PP2C family serine/threonine-protein phosphatase n=1 Tax=Endozoicomonas sp. TaxID=1892382 RepID=UPI00383B7A07